MAAPSRAGMLGGVQGSGPAQVQPRQLKKYVFSTGEVPIEQTLPYIIVVNADAVAHTITAKSVIQSDSDIPFNVPTNGVLPIPTLPFKSLSIDGAGNAANVYAFYSDVHLSPGPSAAAGSGYAASVSHDFFEAITPNANNTLQMGGLGSVLTLTPKGGGNATATILVVICFTFTPASTDTCEIILRFGTGTPPLLNAAATGTATDFFALFKATAAGIQQTGVLVGVITGRAIAVALWADVAAVVTNTATDGITINQASISELPA